MPLLSSVPLSLPFFLSLDRDHLMSSGKLITLPEGSYRDSLVAPEDVPEFCVFCVKDRYPRYCAHCDMLVLKQRGVSTTSDRACLRCIQYARTEPPILGHSVSCPLSPPLAKREFTVVPDQDPLPRHASEVYYKSSPPTYILLDFFNNTRPSPREVWVELGAAAESRDMTSSAMADLVLEDFQELLVASVDNKYWITSGHHIAPHEAHLIITFEEWSKIAAYMQKQ